MKIEELRKEFRDIHPYNPNHPVTDIKEYSLFLEKKLIPEPHKGGKSAEEVLKEVTKEEHGVMTTPYVWKPTIIRAMERYAKQFQHSLPLVSEPFGFIKCECGKTKLAGLECIKSESGECNLPSPETVQQRLLEIHGFHPVSEPNPVKEPSKGAMDIFESCDLPDINPIKKMEVCMNCSETFDINHIGCICPTCFCDADNNTLDAEVFMNGCNILPDGSDEDGSDAWTKESVLMLMKLFNTAQLNKPKQVTEDLTIDDYKECIESHNASVRELDEIINGKKGMAKQASLCDIVSQVKGMFDMKNISDNEIEKMADDLCQSPHESPYWRGHKQGFKIGIRKGLSLNLKEPKGDSVQTERESEWISVDERLPEIGVIVNLVLKHSKEDVYSGFRAKGGWYCFKVGEESKQYIPNGIKEVSITKWKPLPTPSKVDNK